MTLVQAHYRGRSDSQGLNATSFDQPIDTGWSQEVGKTFRVRFEVEETAGLDDQIPGALEANLNGGSWFNVTTVSGTVYGSPSEKFKDEDTTSDVIYGSNRSFTSGYGANDGVSPAVTLNDKQTELEFSLRIATGISGTIGLRLAGLDTYAQTPALIALVLAPRDRVRAKAGDNDGTERLDDTQIDGAMANWPGNEDLAAAECADLIRALYANGYTFSTDGQSFNRRERVEHYADLAKDLRSRGGSLIWPPS